MRFPTKLTFLALACAACTQAHAQTARAPQPANAYSAAPWPDPADTPFGQQLLAIVNNSGVSRAHWGIAITAMDGTPIFGFNQGQFFRPASNATLYTGVTALALLGPTRKFETRVITTGTIDASGTLHGDLRLEGRGDANFGEEDVPYTSPANRTKPPVTGIPDIEDLVRKIAAKGVKSVDGGIIASDAYFANTPYLKDWAWGDRIWAYAAPVSALTIRGNQLDVSVTPAAAVGQPANISYVPDNFAYYNIDNQIVTAPGPGSCDERIDIAFTEPARTLHLHGAIAPGHAPCKLELAIQDPPHYAAFALKTALERRGIPVSGDITIEHQQPGDQSMAQPLTAEAEKQADDDLEKRFSAASINLPACSNGPDPGPNPTPAGPGQTLLATHAAPPLRLDLTLTNKVDDNLHAEIFLRNLASALCQPRTLENSLRIREQFLTRRAGIDPADLILDDGSGLSGNDLVTPRATAQLLRFAATQPWFADFKASLPISGEDGTLADRFGESALRDHIFANAGTLGEASALSGYLEAASGKTIIISIMIDTHAPGSADQQLLDHYLDRFLAAIAAAN